MCGVTSRRKADELIRSGRVRVNDEVVRDLGVKVDPEIDRVEVDGREVRPPRRRYIALNKPAGRLDRDTEGLLILTNDGELAHRILHPRYKLPKTYLALVRGRVSSGTVRRMLKGIELEDGFAEGKNTLLEAVFHEGRKHLVKRFLARFGHPVVKLKRTAVGPVKLGKLPPGKWRDLTPGELEALFSAVGLKYNS